MTKVVLVDPNTTVLDAPTTWADFYQSRVGVSYVEHIANAYEPLIHAIISRALAVAGDTEGWPVKVVESGSGIGSVSINLAKMSSNWVNCSGFDVSAGQVAHSRENALLNNIADKVSFTTGDIFDANQYVDAQIIHSHGVLEHFSDEDIMEILLTQLSAPTVRYVIHYVPLAGWVTPSYGDERLLPLSYWVDKFCPTSTVAFNEGKDAVLIWNVQDLLNQ